MTPLAKFYTDDPRWHAKIGDIHALLERVKISEEQSGDVLQLRKRSRILSVHASTAIEGNQLTLGQVTDVINGKPVWGPPKDIKEVQNAWQAVAGQTKEDVPINVPINVPIRVDANVGVGDKILDLLRINPKATIGQMGQEMGGTDRTIKRHLKTLREQGRLKRIGARKTGHWVVIEGPQ